LSTIPACIQSGGRSIDRKSSREESNSGERPHFLLSVDKNASELKFMKRVWGDGSQNSLESSSMPLYIFWTRLLPLAAPEAL
jgi:hypothetical protein